MTTKRKRYTREFKLEAVRLLEEGRKPPADLACELGIQRNQLYKWQEQLQAQGDKAFPCHVARPQRRPNWPGSNARRAAANSIKVRYAARNSEPDAGLLHHSDRGNTYTSVQCRRLLEGPVCRSA